MNLIEKAEADNRALRAEVDRLTRERDRLAAALRLCLDYMGRPPTNSMSFDSEWEDAWKAARAALREVDGP